jgi:hypothetical protein
MLMDFIHIVQLNKLKQLHNTVNKTKVKMTCTTRSMIETHTREITYTNRNSESKFDHAFCKYNKCNSCYTYDIFNIGHYYGNFESY